MTGQSCYHYSGFVVLKGAHQALAVSAMQLKVTASTLDTSHKLEPCFQVVHFRYFPRDRFTKRIVLRCPWSASTPRCAGKEATELFPFGETETP